MSDLTALAEFIQDGRKLKDEGGPTQADSAFDYWVHRVKEWLQTVSPESPLAVEWLSLGDSDLVRGGGYYDDEASWNQFRNVVAQRLNWLTTLPAKLKAEEAAPERIQAQAFAAGRREVRFNTTARAFVDPDRISELMAIKSDRFDFLKLIRLCEELNINFATECYLATSMLVRGVLDHVAPVFNSKNFHEVANNYSGGSRSFRDSMLNLDNSSRKIADQHLHCQIRTSEVLPNARQVDFGSDLDVLLAEIVRIHK